MEDHEILSQNLERLLTTEKQEPTKDDPEKMWSVIEKSQIHYSQHFSKPPAIMSLIETGKEDIPIMTLGNFSLFKGQAKSRKTFGLSMLASSLSTGKTLYGKFRPSIGDKVTIFIDTEQSEYHVYRFVNSVVNTSGLNDQSNQFWALCLRPYETSMRLKIVEFLVYNAVNLGYVIIDGIRDLIKDVNSLEEATMITDKLLKWTKEKNIHISVVLHENPSKENTKARGHIGTELTNKAETIIRFEKNPRNKSQTIIRADDTRGEEFEPIYFEIDKNERGPFPVVVEPDIAEVIASEERF